MDLLGQCIFEFQKLLNKDFYYTFENGLTIKLFFAKKHFHHLLGLGKLSDILPLVVTKNNTPTAIYKNIEKGKITYADIQKSSYFTDIEERILYFKDLNSILFEKAVIDFDKSKVNTKIKSNIILFQDKGPCYLHLCLSQDKKELYYFPETFLVQHDDYYIKNQNILKISEFWVIDTKTNLRLLEKKYVENVINKALSESAASAEIQLTTNDKPSIIAKLMDIKNNRKENFRGNNKKILPDKSR